MKKQTIYDAIILVRTEGVRKYDNLYISVVMNLQKKYGINTTEKGVVRKYLPSLNALTRNEWNDLFHIHREAFDICKKLNEEDK